MASGRSRDEIVRYIGHRVEKMELFDYQFEQFIRSLAAHGLTVALERAGSSSDRSAGAAA